MGSAAPAFGPGPRTQSLSSELFCSSKVPSSGYHVSQIRGLSTLIWIPPCPSCPPRLQSQKLPCSARMLLDCSRLWERVPPMISCLKGFGIQCGYNKVDSPGHRPDSTLHSQFYQNLLLQMRMALPDGPQGHTVRLCYAG